MPTFLYPWLALAGVAAAAAPVIVHLLNRRRFRVVEWAAMDFLREAVTKSHRFMELRDLLLLLVRVACLLAFGCALARPYWSQSAATALDPNQPVHAVVLVDNSLSMGYQMADGILLDQAKVKARLWVEALPSGSVVTVLPTCASANGTSYEALARKEDVFDALAAINVVDRRARSGPVIDLAIEACRRTTNIRNKKLVLITDQQVADWSAEAESGHLKQLPCPMEVVQVTADDIENVWVADVQLRDGVANIQRPASFMATISYQGRSPRHDVAVVLKVDGVTAAVEKIDLQPGQSREVIFPDYRISPTAADKQNAANKQQPAATTFLTAEVSIAASSVPFDRLPSDNMRSIVAHVTGSLPIVFIDAIGAHEDPKRKIRGDTWWLRRWLAPLSSATSADAKQGLVEARQITIEQLTRPILADARLVVIGGVNQPTPAEVALLKEYVEQGGNLILAAGGRFDPAAWTDIAWKDGLGILPTPLAPSAIGYLRKDKPTAAPLTLKFSSLASDYFRPEGVSDEDLRAMLGPPTLFFKTVVAQCDEAVKDRAVKAASDYFTKQRDHLIDIDRKLAALQKGGDRSSSDGNIAELQRQRETIEPSWLTWKKDLVQVDQDQQTVAELAEQARPVVLASYSNDNPMLLWRRWGRGQILFLTTSLSPDWTTLHDLPQSAWLMDRIARGLLAETVPSKTFSSEQGLVMPIAATDRNAQITLVDPAGQRQTLTVDSLGGDRYGISLGNWTQRGIYHVTAVRATGDSGGAGVKLWDIPLAVNGPAEESQLAPAISASANGQTRSFIDATAQTYSTAPIQIVGFDLWKLLIGVMLFLLLVEFLLAARFVTRPEASA